MESPVATALGTSPPTVVANFTTTYYVQVVSLFHASGLYWMVIRDGGTRAFYYTTSQTGLSWTALQPLGIPFSYAPVFYYSPTLNTLYYAYIIPFRTIGIYRLQPDSNGTLTVAGSESVDVPNLSGEKDYVEDVYGLTVDPQGRLWVAVRYGWLIREEQNDYTMPLLLRGSATNGTFGSIDNGFPVALDNPTLYTSYTVYLLPHPSLGAVTVYQSAESQSKLRVTWWNGSTPVANYFFDSNGPQYPLTSATICRDRLIVLTSVNSYVWVFDANGLNLLNRTSYPGYSAVSLACDASSGLVYMAYLSSGQVYYANYSAYSYRLGQATAVASTGGTVYSPAVATVGSNLLIAWHEQYSGYRLVKTAVADTLTLATGIPVNLTLTANIAPNDTIAPHLYTWYFGNTSSYVSVNNFIVNSQAFAIVMDVRQLVPYYNYGFEWSILKSGSYWFGEFSITIGPAGGSLFRIQYVGSSSDAYTSASSNYMEDLAWHNIVAMYDGATMYYYVDGSMRSSRNYSVTRYISTSTLHIGIHGSHAFYPHMESPVIIYSRNLSTSEINNIYAYNIINSSGLTLFLDATFYNGTVFLDLSGLGYNGVGYGNVNRVADTRQWLYLVKNLSRDGLVHFRFFPVNTRIEVYDTNNKLVTSFIITGTPNVAGLIEDYAVSLPAGNYTVRVYTYLDKTVSQNNGSSRYTYMARHSPGDAVRLALSTNALGSLRYQVYNQTTGQLALDNTVSTNLNYIDIQLPATNSTWLIQAFAGAPVLYWSNQVALGTDYLVLNASSSRQRTDLSTGISASYTVRYSDGSVPPALSVGATTVLTQLGVYTLAAAWWRIDVYSGVRISAEPPGTGYTYKGTVYPLFIHSFFASGLFYVPSGYDTSYVYFGVSWNDAPYWAKAVGAPSTSFALVYQSLVYLPLSGNYTFELVSDDGARLYVNGTMVIDGWGGPGTRTATVSLTAGWYNITIKYWQAYSALHLTLGVTLPNGTAVKPLRPAYGIQMKPPDTSYNVSMPSPPLVLVKTIFTTASNSISLGLDTVGLANLTLQVYDYGTWFNTSRSVQLIWDQVIVNSVTPSKPRFTVGDMPSFNITAVYAFDGSPFQGSFTLNDTSTKTSVGAYGYSITGVSDSLYGITRFSGNTTTTAIFDKLVLDSYVFTVNGVVLANNTRVDYKSLVSVSATLKHAYDGLVLSFSNAVRVELAGVSATWDGSAWVATLLPPGRITAVSYSVVSYAESKLGVRLIDPVVFRVIYDSVNATYYASDLEGNTVTLRLVYGYDGALVPSGTACINDSDTVVCGSISNGYVTLGFNRFTNGTVSFINATDGVFVYTNPVKPDKLVVKWVSGDGRISLTATSEAYYINHTELPGYFRLACELKGNASILVNTSLPPVLVKVNGAPASFTYVNGMLLLYGVSSTVEAYYSTPVSAVTLPGAAPVGAVYEIGFADDPVLENSTLMIGVLVNGSSVVPFIRYNGSTSYAGGVSGLSFPLDVAVSWECSGGATGVNAMVVYMLGNSTYYSTLRSVFSSVKVASCPITLYPYLLASGNVPGVVDRYGGIASEVLKYVATGVLRFNVVGPIPAGGLVKYVTLSSPIRIVYSMGNVYTEPGSGSMLTLVGFKGFTLSYSVVGTSVSNILIARDEYPLDFPRGISLLVVADPSSRTVSIVQASPVSEPREFRTITAPEINVPALPEPQPPVFPGWDSPSFIVLYGAAVAVAIIATRMTGSVPRGIMVAATAFGLVTLGIGVFTRDLSAVSIAVVALVTAVGIEVARRQAT
ncbi:hypothetical protein HAV2_gp10 [Hyperthermophilic Archaeal Virus 2]|uniref:hypothetical protein n=1 Tax=Hyperthermophilic Archaeal Virus 2 TaxID=762906 RepID=UPI0001DBAE1D|nr:hypothetical protein HAV2_gp10 [Hyperthermophilic Archaeal Virus 2]ADJ54273.1 hypothetical protein HAV2_gp10 [Hyperthermophilic Archaeal Virus 2]